MLLFLFLILPLFSTEQLFQFFDLPEIQEASIFWNGLRPSQGRYTFLVSVRQNGIWSPPIFYAEWGASEQIAFRDSYATSSAWCDEGKVKMKTAPADALSVRVIASGGADLSPFASLSLLTSPPPLLEAPPLSSLLIDPFPRKAQIRLRHPRYHDLSLPTSLSLLLNHFFQSPRVDPVEFAAKVVDDDTSFYENWSLNGAEASHRLQGEAKVIIAHLSGLKELHTLVSEGKPVVVPLLGWIPKAPRPYRTEHAVCVIGFDGEKKEVLCVDPAFLNDASTFVSYPQADFLKSWDRCGRKALYLLLK